MAAKYYFEPGKSVPKFFDDERIDPNFPAPPIGTVLYNQQLQQVGVYGGPGKTNAPTGVGTNAAQNNPNNAPSNIPTGVNPLTQAQIMDLIARNANTQQGNQLDYDATVRGQDKSYEAALANIYAQLAQSQQSDANRLQIAGMGDVTQRRGQDFDYQTALMNAQTQKEIAGLNDATQRLGQQQNYMLGLARLAADRGQLDQSRWFQEQSANLERQRFVFDQQKTQLEQKLAYTQMGLQQQQNAAAQQLGFANLDLDQRRFALEKQKAQAEMAANPFNAFANAYFVRGQQADPALAGYGTPGSESAYGLPAIQEPAMPSPQMAPPVRAPSTPDFNIDYGLAQTGASAPPSSPSFPGTALMSSPPAPYMMPPLMGQPSTYGGYGGGMGIPGGFNQSQSAFLDYARQHIPGYGGPSSYTDPRSFPGGYY